MAKKTASIEDQLRRLEEISSTLDRGDVSIDEQLTLFTEGMALAKTAREYLEKAELKIKQLGALDEEA